MGRSIGSKEGRVRVKSTPDERLSIAEQKQITPGKTKIKFDPEAKTNQDNQPKKRSWDLKTFFDVLGLGRDGKVIYGYRATGHRVGKVSPNHPLIIKND